MKLAIYLAFTATALPQIAAASGVAEALPKFIEQMIDKAARHDGTVIEEARYKGQRAFHVIAGNRPADGGNEHILYSNDGHIVCEFGGIAGHVTVGSCDIASIKYVRNLRGARH